MDVAILTMGLYHPWLPLVTVDMLILMKGSFTSTKKENDTVCLSVCLSVCLCLSVYLSATTGKIL